MNIVAAVPGVFTANGQGARQASALNRDGRTANSPAAPAAAGSAITFEVTGMGQTLPASVDGSIAALLLPNAVAPVLGQHRGDLRVSLPGAARAVVVSVDRLNGLGPFHLRWRALRRCAPGEPDSSFGPGGLLPAFVDHR